MFFQSMPPKRYQFPAFSSVITNVFPKVGIIFGIILRINNLVLPLRQYGFLTKLSKMSVKSLFFFAKPLFLHKNDADHLLRYSKGYYIVQ